MKLPEVKNMTGLGKSTIYEMMKDGRFPHNIKLGKRSVAWPSDQIEHWMNERVSNA
jgi:prophage regulatory protein